MNWNIFVIFALLCATVCLEHWERYLKDPARSIWLNAERTMQYQDLPLCMLKFPNFAVSRSDSK